jgi:V8-like Glu-specific endopeptidase
VNSLICKREALRLAVGALMSALVMSAAASASPMSDAAARADAVAAHEYWTQARMREAIANSTPSAVTATASRRPRPAPTHLLGMRTIGRVFSVLPDGTGYACTGTLVDSANRSLVWTAGHCLHRGRRAGFHTKVVFVPGYQAAATGNSAPYGVWPASLVAVTGSWIAKGYTGPDFGGSWRTPQFDGGALVLARDAAGRTLTDALGVSQHIAFSRRVRGRVRMIGYPAHAPYTGEQLMQCGPQRAHRRRWAPRLYRVSCPLNHGMSGGPTIARMDSLGVGVVLGPITAFDGRRGLFFSENRGELRLLYRTYTGHPN